MRLADLISDLRLDLSDPDASLFSLPTLERCVRKAVYRVSHDLKLSLNIISEELSPDPGNEVKELLLILSHIHACQVMRSATANAFSFSSGDKKVDKTKQPEHWAKLEGDLTEDYKRQLAALSPSIEVDEEFYIITPSTPIPVIYEQGKDL